MSKKTWYIAGPMSGIPHFNFPQFEEVAWQARNIWKMDVICPTELDDPSTYQSAKASRDGSPKDATHKWGEFLGRDVEVVADQCDGIIFLPHWDESRGAVLEATTGLLCNHTFGVVHKIAGEWVFRGASRKDIAERVWLHLQG